MSNRGSNKGNEHTAERSIKGESSSSSINKKKKGKSTKKSGRRKIGRHDNSGFRHFFQVFWLLITNGHLVGFLKGQIYQGKLKQVCVPGLNCYSCAGALGSCPIGSTQAVIGKKGHYFSFYMVGFLMLVGTLIGRVVCGWLCPFGLVQDLLHKIPFPKKVRTLWAEKYLVKIKYAILVVFVIILPMFFVNPLGNGDPYFCKYVCPVGMLEGGLFFTTVNETVRGAIGFLFLWKNIILISTVLLSIIVYRPFCKVICPLGAIYSLFNKVSVFRYYVDMEKCIKCGRCADVCFMNVDPVQDANALECIRCGKCKGACPVKAISSGFTVPVESIKPMSEIKLQ